MPQPRGSNDNAVAADDAWAADGAASGSRPGGPLRVAIISHVDPTGTYGSASSLRHHLAALSAAPEINLAVFCPPEGDLAESPKHGWLHTTVAMPVAVRPNYQNVSGLARGAAWLARSLRPPPSHADLKAWQPDVIHLNSLTLEPMIRWCARDPALSRVPIVASVRESLTTALSSPRRALLGSLSHYVCISPVTRRHLLIALDDSLAERTTVIPNLIGTPVSALDRLPAGSPVAPGNDPTPAPVSFAFIGRLEPDKGPQRIIRAFRRAGLDDCELLLIGGGRHPLGWWLRMRCRSTPQVRCVGVMPEVAGSALYSSIDVIVRGDHRYLGLGRVGQEALAAGKLLVMPDPGGDPVTPSEADTNSIVWMNGQDEAALTDALMRARDWAIARRRNPGGTAPSVAAAATPTGTAPIADPIASAAGGTSVDAYCRAWQDVYTAATGHATPSSEAHR